MRKDSFKKYDAPNYNPKLSGWSQFHRGHSTPREDFTKPRYWPNDDEHYPLKKLDLPPKLAAKIKEVRDIKVPMNKIIEQLNTLIGSENATSN